MTDVTIVVLMKNAARYVNETIPAILGQESTFSFEILVIDSGSTDGTLEALKSYPVRIVNIPPESFNHGETRNLGAREAAPDSWIIVYLSQDATPANSQWLENLAVPFQEDPKVAGVFSRHTPRKNSTPSMVRQLTTVWQSGSPDRIIKEMPVQPEIYERERFYYIYFSNTSSAIRRDIWRKIPLHKVSFAEDAVWADDVLRAGYRIVYQPTSVVIHSHDYNFMEQFRQNVDHTHAMKLLFHPEEFESSKTWFRQIRAIPRQVWRDWYFTIHSQYFQGASWFRKIKWMIYSPFWHLASSMGAWIGATLDHYPHFIRLYFSRQERIRQS